MTVVCAACGKVSNDREFCDHCNADLLPAEERLPPARCPLPGGAVELAPEQRQALARVEDAVTLAAGPERWRVHWVPRREWPAWEPLVVDRLGLELEVLPACQTLADDGGVWVACRAAPSNGRPWHERHAAADPVTRLNDLVADVASLAHTLEELHRHGRVWLNFDPAALEDAGPLPTAGPHAVAAGLRRWRPTNLDVRLFRRWECPPALRFNAACAPPEVCGFRAAEIGPATDVYHVALFAYYWCAGLLPAGFAGAGLEAFEHRLPPLRPYAPDLPEGVIPAILRGLAAEPRRRYATPQEFVATLAQRRDEASLRRGYGLAVGWEAGGHTDTGRSKEAVGRSNEDQYLLRDCPGGTLAAVADGISTCDVGSGALASLVAAIILENRFEAGTSHEQFPTQVAEACLRGAQSILDWALEKGYREQLALGLDLMGTTLTVAWLQGREVSLANLGDSRAYLVTDRWVDQLTIDGDLGTELLTRGAPPEQVQRMGTVARALRGCVGGCTVNDGRVEVFLESCTPTLSRWPLVPGDVVLLCTDGLIEEGYFLEPEAAADLVRAHRALPAVALARRLVEAANALQRLPSPTEPEGFGDNITCVVIKIEGGET